MTKQNNKVYIHLVWSTADRAPTISPETQSWLWPALAESARALGSLFVVVGGTADHIHVLVHLPVTVSIAEVVRRLKGASSRWLHLRGLSEFAWQEGYGAFSIRHADVPLVESYVRNQDHHHSTGQTDQDMEIAP